MAQINLGRVVGYSAYEVAVQNGFIGTEEEWLESLHGSDGAEAPHPFKGWFDSPSDLPSNPSVGDYAYVHDADPAITTSIYKCATAGTWEDSGVDVDTSNVQTFESGEEVNETYIDDTHLVNPKSGALPKAEDVMQLKTSCMLNTLMIDEVKQQFTLSKGYVTWNTGALAGTTSSVTRYCKFAIPANVRKIRFLGIKYAQVPSAGFAFYDDEDTYIQGFPYLFDSSLQANETVEYVVDVPTEAAYFITSVAIGGGVLNADNFYCYYIYNNIKDNLGIYSRKPNAISMQLETEQGPIFSNGTSYPVDSSNYKIQKNRVRSKFVFVNGRCNLSFTNGIWYNIYYYFGNTQDTYVKRTSESWLTEPTYSIDWVGYIRIVFRTEAVGNVTVEDFDASITYESLDAYENNVLNSFAESDVKIKIANLAITRARASLLGTFSSFNVQSFLMYNNKYIVLRNSTNSVNLAVYDATFTVEQTGRLAVGHANAFQLGTNGKAYVSGWDDNKVYVVDLATLTIESTITLPVSGYTTVAVDDLNHLMYIFYRETYPDTIANYQFIVYDYQSQTILSQKTIEAFWYMQSVDYYQGKIYMCWGAPQHNAASGMRVYNTNGDVLFDIEIDAFRNAEPEGIFVDRESGDLLVSGVANVYKISN